MKRFVMLSNGGAHDPDPDSDLYHYAQAKKAADEHLKASGVPYAIIRPGALTHDDGARNIRLGDDVEGDGTTARGDLAAVLARGTTVLENAAREPEIVDLAQCLRKMGARIEGEGTSRIEIEGVDRLGGATHRVVTDRIELGTYMLAPAICGGEVECLGGRIDLLQAFCEKLDEAGISVEETATGLKVARKNGRVRAVNVVTEPFPGFPTDLQAQMMALLCTAEGTSVLEEKIFENRFMHVPELSRMGADINVHGASAIVRGVKWLSGAQVMATDLRASVSLVLAGLAAEGETVINRVYHLDRGYERLEEKLAACGADIRRVRE